MTIAIVACLTLIAAFFVIAKIADRMFGGHR